ncbi:MAG: hypothetical protein QOG71_3892 [Pyrinomonadaceae bacterium]|nr:hypothetical protein [Pyrinomonadaceae bacterium]
MKKVFLSYSHKDKHLVEKVAVLLKDRGVDVWLDEWRLRVGESVIKEVEQSIRRADYVVIFISKYSVKSRWVQAEYEAAANYEMNYKKKIIVLSAVLDDSKLPAFLQRKKYADFQESFVEGYSGLLNSILKAKAKNSLDQTFSELARKLRMDHRSKHQPHMKMPSFIEKLTDRKIHLLGSVYYSSLDLHTRLKRSDGSIEDSDNFSKWLGNTIRDYLQYKIFEDAEVFLRSKNFRRKRLATPQVKIGLLDYLHERINSNIREYGLPQRRTESHIIDDLQFIFGDDKAKQIPPQ